MLQELHVGDGEVLALLDLGPVARPPKPPMGCFCTWNTPVPSCDMSLRMASRMPLVVADMATTAMTPMTMPSSVSAERSLCAPSVPSAANSVSLNA
jgi:hypothetical protein